MISKSFLLKLVLLATCASSCITDQKLIQAYHADSTYNGFAGNLVVNGQYRNLLNESQHWNYFSDNLLPSFKIFPRYRVYHDSVQTVSLDYDSKKQLLVTVQYKSGAAKQYRLKAEKKDRYISLKRQFLLVPLLVFNLYVDQKTILFTDSSGSLVCVRGYHSFGLIIGAAGGSKTNRVTRYPPASAPTPLPRSNVE